MLTMKKTISLFLLTLMLLQCCAVYQKTPVPLSEAQNRGKALIIDNKNKKIRVDKIYRINEQYYASYRVREKDKDGEYQRFGHTIQLEDDNVQVYLSKDEATPSRIWVELSNKTKVTGVLYDVTDSSIWVINNLQGANSISKKDFLNQKYGKEEYMAKDIIKIKLRKGNKVGSVAGKGALIGAGVMVITGWFLGGGNNDGIFTVFLLGGTGAFGLVAGGIVGAIIGSNKVKLPLNGSIENYNQNIYLLKQYAVIK